MRFLKKLREFTYITILAISTSLTFVCCATVGQVRVIGRSNKPPPSWISEAPQPGYFLGMISVEDQSKGLQEAINNVKQQITNTSGFEQISEYERRTMIFGQKIKKSNIEIYKEHSGALLEDVESNVTGAYWEKCKEKIQRGYKLYYRFFVLVHYPESKVKFVRKKTAFENERRLKQLNESLLLAEKQKNDGYFVDALQTLIYGYLFSNTLFTGRNVFAIQLRYKIRNLISLLQMEKHENYSERSPTRHEVSVELSMNQMPSKNIPVNFRIVKGFGNLENTGYSNANGVAASKVYMESIQEDNQINVYIDLSELLSVDSRLSDIKGRKEVNFTFSTLSKISDVKAGTLYLKKEGFLTQKLYLRFDLRELNGLGATFYRYELEFHSTYRNEHWFSSKVDVWSDSAKGDFNLEKQIRIDANEVDGETLPLNLWVINTIKDFIKRDDFHEMEITLTLYGRDDNNNICTVNIYSSPLTKRHF